MKQNQNITERTISNFLDKEYRGYSNYVIQNRACPSLIDGFKTGARKIMHAAMKGSLKNGETKKVTALAGETMTHSLYQHGDASLNGTIITLSQEFDFNLNPLFIDGQNGSLRSQDAASPRYLYVRHSKYTPIWKTDYDLLEFEEEEGEQVEPKYYLPIIPVLLAQRQEGMAPGYRFSNMSYDPVDIIDACITVLNSKKKENKLDGFVLHPYIKGIKKKNWKYETEENEVSHWVNYGEFKWDEKRKEIIIKDLPYDMDFDSFEKLLNKLVEKEEIKDWKNLSSGTDIEYHIDCKRGKWAATLKGKLVNKKIEQKLKLRKVVPDDLLWVIDENKKVKHFSTPYELIEYFVNFRLLKYNDRKKRLVKILEERLKKNDDLVKFIELVCKGKLKIRNRSKKEIKVDMDSYKLPMELISTPMSKVTIEERDELLKQNEAMRKELEYIKKTTEKQMYINDLNDLRKDLEKDFK
jgi:DNA topoisomerase-2